MKCLDLKRERKRKKEKVQNFREFYKIKFNFGPLLILISQKKII